MEKIILYIPKNTNEFLSTNVINNLIPISAEIKDKIIPLINNIVSEALN